PARRTRHRRAEEAALPATARTSPRHPHRPTHPASHRRQLALDNGIPAEKGIRAGRGRFTTCGPTLACSRASPVPIATDDCAMMPPHAAATGVPGHHERIYVATTATWRRPRQGHRDPVAALPARGVAAPPR